MQWPQGPWALARSGEGRQEPGLVSRLAQGMYLLDVHRGLPNIPVYIALCICGVSKHACALQAPVIEALSSKGIEGELDLPKGDAHATCCSFQQRSNAEHTAVTSRLRPHPVSGARRSTTTAGSPAQPCCRRACHASSGSATARLRSPGAPHSRRQARHTLAKKPQTRSISNS